MFGWRKQSETIPVGTQFRRIVPSKGAEVAQVVAIGADRSGIPHVRFRLRLERTGGPAILASERTLSLSAFKALFPERLTH